ncbi:uncharacterized protein LOC109280983 isoform X1 [Alligator mississippiensis]|nr:uncharacterized protein LOC109280983 isoform X1 [Alligator mississippiensis]
MGLMLLDAHRGHLLFLSVLISLGGVYSLCHPGLSGTANCSLDNLLGEKGRPLIIPFKSPGISMDLYRCNDSTQKWDRLYSLPMVGGGLQPMRNSSKLQITISEGNFTVQHFSPGVFMFVDLNGKCLNQFNLSVEAARGAGPKVNLIPTSYWYVLWIGGCGWFFHFFSSF